MKMSITIPEITPSLLAGSSIVALGVAAWLHPVVSLPAVLAAGAVGVWRAHRAGFGPGVRPGSAGPLLLGRRLEDGTDYRLSYQDLREHILVLGEDGAGKTDAYLGMCENALAAGSGFMMVDCGGDPALFPKLYALARQHGREDDVLFLNFAGMNDRLGETSIQSNTMNPFSTGASDSLASLLSDMMDIRGPEHEKSRELANLLLTGLMRALVRLRDNGMIELNVFEIRDRLNLRAIIDLANPEQYPDAVIPRVIRESFLAYLEALPGYQPGTGYKQSQETLDQHGFLEMLLAGILGNLADVYGHISRGVFSDVEMRDVVVNRRILVVRLPSVKNGEADGVIPGRFLLGALYRATRSFHPPAKEGLGFPVADLRAERRAEMPFLAILDDVGHYAIDGMDALLSEAQRSNVSLVFGASDLEGMKRLDDKSVWSVASRCGTLIAMSLPDAATARLAASLVDAFVARTGMRTRVTQDGSKDGDPAFKELARLSTGEMLVHRQESRDRVQAHFVDPMRGINRRRFKASTNRFLVIPKRARIA